ncbi:hypothetical protein OHC33_001433 [Knufia fluminis]|uniref:Uncharacterized protein n=1 Tax=Knufia fluminis TaxID=191047 RepID=A0AAN8I891_9EURO|nr:hypothetical protein OHC33_001433 [Knufia fluminis]
MDFALCLPARFSYLHELNDLLLKEDALNMEPKPSSQTTATHRPWTAVVTSNLPQVVELSPSIQPSNNGSHATRASDQAKRLQQLLDEERKKTKGLQSKHAQEQKELSSEIAKLEKSLAETRTKLIRLLPEDGPSDDQVKQAFEDLCHNIEAWVDLQCGDLNDLSARMEKRQWTEQDQQLLDRHITDDDVELARAYPDISPHIVMCAIVSNVFDLCLANGRWVLGMSNEEEALLNDIADHIPNACGSNGHVAQKKWRAETYRALANQQHTLEYQKMAVENITQALSSFLNHFRNSGSGHINPTKIQDKIVEQAHKLADLGKGTMTEYRLDFPTNSSDKNRKLEKDETSNYSFVDAGTGVEIDGNVVQAGGKLRLCVFPALVKVLESGEKRLANAMVVLQQ